MRLDGDVRVEAGERAGGALGLRPADLGGGVQDLALEVGEADRVVVDDAEGADAGGGEVEERRAAEAAGPDDEHAGGAEALLAGAADLVQHDVAGVAGELVRGEGHPPVPVEPKPPAPRALAASASASAQAMRATGASTSWAMRSPWAMVTGSAPWLMRMTPDLAAVVAVDGAGGVEERQALAQREAGARADLHLVAGRDLEGEAGRDEGAGAGGEGEAAGAVLGREVGLEVHAGGAGGGVGRQRQGGVAARQAADADGDAHASACGDAVGERLGGGGLGHARPGLGARRR